MNRVFIGDGGLWFDKDRAQSWAGKYDIAGRLWRTPKGRFFLESGIGKTIDELALDHAYRWLVRNGCDVPEDVLQVIEALEV
jgi:hypothetical protein